MSDNAPESTGPDLSAGVAASELTDGAMLVGHVGDKSVLLAQRGTEYFAIGATCTHYSGPLGAGLLVGDTVRCPWHHACFSLRTGEAVGAPALNPVACWAIEQRDGSIFVTRERQTVPVHRAAAEAPSSVVIVGAGAAGNAAAEILRREGYAGPITMIGGEDAVPYDRPNLSKDYLAGSAPEEWIPLRPREFYMEQEIQLITGVRVTSIDTAAKRVTLGDASTHEYGALLLATGAEPIKLPTPGGERILYLRSLADSRAIIGAAAGAKSAVVIGASFIGLEVAASLRHREIDVHVVGPEPRPLERVLGAELGDFVRSLHEKHGVVFHLGHTVASIQASTVTLDDGTTLNADIVIAGIGVRPCVDLAEQAGLSMDRGISVNEFLETSAPGIYAAGDIARFPDPHSGASIRVEHWVVAERMGQAAARNMLGKRERFADVPFFWSQHYDVAISYVGHAEKWDVVEIDGSVKDGDCAVRFVLAGKTLAVATVGRDMASLMAEREIERSNSSVP